jgi:hypothetical protein
MILEHFCNISHFQNFSVEKYSEVNNQQISPLPTLYSTIFLCSIFYQVGNNLLCRTLLTVEGMVSQNPLHKPIYC